MPFTVVLVLAVLLAQTPPPILPAALTGPNFTNRARTAMQRSHAEMLIRSAADSSVRPIPLTRDGSLRFGFAFDDFLYTRAEVARAAGEGRPMSVDDVIVLSRRLIHSAVVAFPLTCGGKETLPIAIDPVIKDGPRAGPAPTEGDLLKGAAEVRRRFGAYDVPEGSIARGFVGTLELSEVRITYADSACSSPESLLKFSFEQLTADADPDGSAFVQLPSGATGLAWPAKTRVSVYIDQVGLPRFPVFIDGPEALEAAAIAHVTKLRFRPYQVNSAAVTESVVLPIMFVGDGTPTAKRMSAADLNPPPLGYTADVANLSLSRSKCPAGDSPTFGLNEREAIPIGGGAEDAVRRERAYLENLRGPFGQGLFFSYPGVINRAGAVIHWYSITYDQLGTSITLFFDPNHAPPGPQRSPPAFACAASFQK